MSGIDFANSYMTFFGKDEGNIARIQLDAACTVTDESADTTSTYYLISPCRSERMYLDTQLCQMPNYEFAGIFAQDVCLFVRTHWSSERDNREYAVNREHFSDVHLDIREFPRTEILPDDAAVVDETLANLPLIGRTELRNPEETVSAVLEYPIKTMNVLRNPRRFQVDTGPVLWPDFDSTATEPIKRFELAYVLYNGLAKAEFILRRPVQIADSGPGAARTTDYSVLTIGAARNTLLCAR